MRSADGRPCKLNGGWLRPRPVQLILAPVIDLRDRFRGALVGGLAKDGAYLPPEAVLEGGERWSVGNSCGSSAALSF